MPSFGSVEVEVEENASILYFANDFNRSMQPQAQANSNTRDTRTNSSATLVGYQQDAWYDRIANLRANKCRSAGSNATCRFGMAMYGVL